MRFTGVSVSGICSIESVASEKMYSEVHQVKMTYFRMREIFQRQGSAGTAPMHVDAPGRGGKGKGNISEGKGQIKPDKEKGTSPKDLKGRSIKGKGKKAAGFKGKGKSSDTHDKCFNRGGSGHRPSQCQRLRRKRPSRCTPRRKRA